MNPDISIVMPTYNRAGSFLKLAIDSALKQSYDNFELIVIDDASVDNTSELIKSYDDKRIVYRSNMNNRGEYWSTNFGISLAKGNYLTWLHSDDLLPKDSLESRIKKLITDSGLDFVHGDIMKIDQFGNEIKKILATDLNSIEVFNNYITNLKLGQMPLLVHHTTILMKRTFFNTTGPFDCTLPFAGDIDWLIRAIRIGNYVRIPQVLYLYRSHSNTRRVLDIRAGINKEEIHKQIANRYK